MSGRRNGLFLCNGNHRCRDQRTKVITGPGVKVTSIQRFASD